MGGAISISSGLGMTIAKSEIEKRICAVLAYTFAGMALILSQV